MNQIAVRRTLGALIMLFMFMSAAYSFNLGGLRDSSPPPAAATSN